MEGPGLNPIRVLLALNVQELAWVSASKWLSRCGIVDRLLERDRLLPLGSRGHRRSTRYGETWSLWDIAGSG
jgi:hypothetical protein